MVQIFPDGGQKATQGLEGILVCSGAEQLQDAVVHDGLGQHAQLEQLTNEADVSQRPSSLLLCRVLKVRFDLLLFVLEKCRWVSKTLNTKDG